MCCITQSAVDGPLFPEDKKSPSLPDLNSIKDPDEKVTCRVYLTHVTTRPCYTVKTLVTAPSQDGDSLNKQAQTSLVV